MFGTRDPEGGPDNPAAMELVRLAIPRRMYTQSHIDYTAEVVIDVAGRSGELTGYRITEQAPWLRHFTCTFEPIA
jgi:tryptophanase